MAISMNTFIKTIIGIVIGLSLLVCADLVESVGTLQRTQKLVALYQLPTSVSPHDAYAIAQLKDAEAIEKRRIINNSIKVVLLLVLLVLIVKVKSKSTKAATEYYKDEQQAILDE